MRYWVCLLKCSLFIYQQGNILIIDNVTFLVIFFLVLLLCHFQILSEIYFSFILKGEAKGGNCFYFFHMFLYVMILWTEIISLYRGRRHRYLGIELIPRGYTLGLDTFFTCEARLPSRGGHQNEQGPLVFSGWRMTFSELKERIALLVVHTGGTHQNNRITFWRAGHLLIQASHTSRVF